MLGVLLGMMENKKRLIVLFPVDKRCLRKERSKKALKGVE